MAMAHPAMYAQQAKGTLMPGQVISVNKYNVQVERFLSQGGFAHVYLVRTAEPVYGTTHHVLKRIAVANESMLNEVKKEVDIMRILKGHPNIVYLMDAAWNKMSDGMYEVFILMEFCQGGGIIDMMNRRLRERLTEAEILQVFVDVCEGVAAMHNLRPSLLHRDLKVENILQASATSYKLCDFGSATPVSPRPPQTTQEIRALEADLNKHTTLQYRAPEMVDVFLRRPIDEKSDVWALGVLLYKLCYYTTPFEEHGVLAILNVQYKFPPYPVYSQQLNELIASMLREHGVHRPSVFEVLDTVHHMRGTKSRFTYTPRPPKPLSPKKQSAQIAAPNTSTTPAAISPESPSPSMNGIQAREKVLEAIAPMRRGRPSTPTTLTKPAGNALNLTDSWESGPWNAQPVKAYKSGLATVSVSKSPPPAPAGASLGQAWEVKDVRRDRSPAAEPTRGFADSFNASSSTVQPISIPMQRPTPPSNRPVSSLRPPGDAFESLNIFPSPRSQSLTLGEAQKASLTAPKPSPSPQPSLGRFSASPASFTSSPIPTGPSPSSFKRDPSPLLKARPSGQSLAAEQRFPSLEELDSQSFGSSFTKATMKAAAPDPAPPRLPPRPSPQPDMDKASMTSFYPASVTGALRPSFGAHNTLSVGQRPDGVRSQHVTGTVMKDVRKVPSPSRAPVEPSSAPGQATPDLPPRPAEKSREKLERFNRPTLTRKHRSSVSIKQTQRTGSDAARSPSPTKRASRSPKKQATDWLTGADEVLGNEPTAILRASPEKRMSVSQSPVPLNLGQEAVRATSPVKRKPVPSVGPKPLETKRSFAEDKENKENDDMTGSGLTENWSPVSPRMELKDSKDDSSSSDEGPEEAVASLKKAPKGFETPKLGHKARTGSVHDLVDLWGGSNSPQFQKSPAASQDKRSSAFLTRRTEETKSPESKPAPGPTATKLSSPSKSKASSNDTPERQAIAKSAAAISRQASLSSKRPTTNHLRQPSSPARPRQATSSGGRARPQSMLIMPVQKSVSENSSNGLPSPSPLSVLSPPPDKPRAAGRRSSISDLVSRYEAINATGGGGSIAGLTNNTSKPATSAVDIGKGAPSPASKPARLRLASSTGSNVSGSVPSPSAAATRFPRLSPTTSPVLSKAPLRTSPSTSPVASRTSLDLPRPSRLPSRDETDASSRSPSPSPVKRPTTPLQKSSSPLLKPSELAASPRLRSVGLGQAGVPSAFARDRDREKPEPPSVYAAVPTRSEPGNVLEQRKQQLQHVHTPVSAGPGTPSKEPVASAGDESPERPYQGVSKLIDQWQKKTEGNESPRSGGLGGFKGPGTGSRFRTGLVAGGKVT